MVNGRCLFEFKPAFADGERYLIGQKSHGITPSLVSQTPQLFLHDAPPSISMELSHLYNRSRAVRCQEHPTALGLATLPLNHAARAKALKLTLYQGLKGAIVRPGIEARTLTHPDFISIWNMLNEAEAILFLHLLVIHDTRIQGRILPNLIGVLWETTMQAVDI